MNVKRLRLRELINATERQKQFFRTIAEHPYTLYGGAAGGGKSYILRWFAVRTVIHAFSLFGVRNTKFGLFCEDYPALRGRHLSVWDVPRELGGIATSKEEGLRFKLKPELGGGMVMLRNLDDPSKYDSEEFIGLAVDEWTKNPWEVFDQLRKRLRWKTIADEPHMPCGGRVADRSGQIIECPIALHHKVPAWNFPFAKGTNPGGIGHGETKRVYIDAVAAGDFSDFPPHLKSIKDLFGFVPAKSSDNPFNPADYKTKNLDTLPEHLRKAYADGDWNIFAGQFFAEWRREKHVCKPFPIPDYWLKWTATDWGNPSPACTLWFARSPEGRTYIYRESYLNKEGDKYQTKDQGKLWVRLAGNELPTYRYKVLDPACFETSRGVSIAQEYAEVGWSAIEGENNRKNGWSRVRGALRWWDPTTVDEAHPHGVEIPPELQVFETCTNLIRTLPAQVFDKHNVDDLDTDAEDHACDALRLGLMPPRGETIKPEETLPSDLAAALRRVEHEQQGQEF